MSRLGSAAACAAIALVVLRVGHLEMIRRRSRDGRQVLRVARPEIEPRPTHASSRRSVIPAGARPEPGDEPCVSRGHTGLAYREDAQWVRWGVRRRWIAEAICSECDRPQDEVHIVFPADHMLPVCRDDHTAVPAGTR